MPSASCFSVTATLQLGSLNFHGFKFAITLNYLCTFNILLPNVFEPSLKTMPLSPQGSGCQIACRFFDSAMPVTPSVEDIFSATTSRHTSVYEPPTPHTEPTPPARLSLEFDEEGAHWALTWVNDDHQDPVERVTKVLDEVASNSSVCTVCGACGVTFSLFFRKRHHQPWVLYEQTQLNHKSLGSLKKGTQLQLMAMSECGIISVIITPYNPPRKEKEKKYLQATASSLKAPVKHDIFRERYNTLAKIYANKTLNKGPEANSNSKTHQSISSADDAESNWDLQYNATINSSDLITLNVWWKSREVVLADYSEKKFFATIPSVSSVTKYMVSWEDAGGTVKGHSVATNTHNSFFLWPQSEYKIQVKVVSGDIANPRLSNVLLFNATKFYIEWNNNQTIQSNPYSHSADIQTEQNGRSADNSPPFENVRDYVYANVDKDYIPQSVQAISFKPIPKTPSPFPTEFTKVTERTSLAHVTLREVVRSPITKPPRLIISNEVVRDVPYYTQTWFSSSSLSDAATTDQHKLVKSKTDFFEDPASYAMSQEVLGGLIGALVILLLVIVAVIAVFCRKNNSFLLLKGVLRSDTYDESTEVAAQKAFRTDLVLSNTDHGKGLSSCTGTGLSKISKGSQRPSSSNSIEFLKPNNSLLSGDTVTTIVPSDPAASFIYGSECSTNSSGTGSNYHNVSYTINSDTGRAFIHGSNVPSMQQLPSPGRAEYSEILDDELTRNAPICVVDDSIYTIPNVPQSHAPNYNNTGGPTTSSGDNDHQIYYRQQMQQQEQQQHPHSKIKSQLSQSGLFSGSTLHNRHNNTNINENHLHQQLQVIYNRSASTQASISSPTPPYNPHPTDHYPYNPVSQIIPPHLHSHQHILQNSPRCCNSQINFSQNNKYSSNFNGSQKFFS